MPRSAERRTDGVERCPPARRGPIAAVRNSAEGNVSGQTAVGVKVLEQHETMSLNGATVAAWRGSGR